jgi:hypothetical protein
MRGHLRDYHISVPQALVDAITRYRHGLDMPAIPSSGEIDPILSETSLKNLMWRLPKMPGLACSPSVLLDRAVGFRRTQLEPPAPPPTSKSESSRQYRIGWKRKQLLVARAAVHHQARADLDAGYHTQECPPPLIGMQQREVFVLSEPQAWAYAKGCFPINCFGMALDSICRYSVWRSGKDLTCRSNYGLVR